MPMLSVIRDEGIGRRDETKTAVQELGKELESLEALLTEEEEAISKPRPMGILSALRAKEDKFSKKEKSLDEIDQKIQQELQETESFLRSRNLPPKILERQRRFVQNYNGKMTNLKQGLNRNKGSFNQ